MVHGTLELAEGEIEPVTGDEPERPEELAEVETDPAGEEAEEPTDGLVEDGAGEALLEPGTGVDPLAGVDSLLVTGHTVIETALVEVTTLVESAGQFVIVAAQLVMVISSVV